MKCDKVFFPLKRLKFGKIKKTEFRPDSRTPTGLQIKICFRVSKRTKTFRYFFLKDKVFSYQKQAVICLEPPSREHPQVSKNCFCLLTWYSKLRNTIRRYFLTCAITLNFLKRRQRNPTLFRCSGVLAVISTSRSKWMAKNSKCLRNNYFVKN